MRQLQAQQVAARDIPTYFEKEPPRDHESFVYVRVEMVWPDSGKASLVDVRMSDAKFNPARFSASFAGGCTDFFRDVELSNQVCLYLSDATFHQIEAQCKHNTLDLPFTLTWDKTCRMKCVEKGNVGPFITFPTRKLP